MIVRIYKPAKSAMQSARGKTHEWVVECELSSRREPDPLMGWISSCDTDNQIRLTFETKEEAVTFAKEKGWRYILSKPKARTVRPRNYADNFRYIPSDYTDARKVVHSTKKPPHQTDVMDDVERT
jgi:hypothetical protein